jgi:Extensin-like protein C-terminus
MSRRIAGFLLWCLGVAALAGCGLNLFAHREPWRTDAEEACLAQKEVQATAYTEPMRAINGPGTCGMDHPFRVAALAQGTIPLSSKAVLACPAISTVDRWLAEVVQPAAETYFATTIAELKLGSYACRSQNNQAGAQISEHAYGNAVDIMAFRFADGRELTVVKGWRGEPQEQDFLREVFIGACRYFTTVLAPGSNAFHYDHIHMDLARHGGQRHICKPVIKWTPSSVPMAAAGADRSGRPDAGDGSPGTVPDIPAPPAAGPPRPATAPARQAGQPPPQAYPQSGYPQQARPAQPDYAAPRPSAGRNPAPASDDEFGEDESALDDGPPPTPPPARPAAAPAPPARQPPVYPSAAVVQATPPSPPPPAGGEPMVLRPPRPIGSGIY